MVQLTFYGGVEEIGGNKLLLEDGERRLLLDFGFPYKRNKLFYEEYLRPRSGVGLLDSLAMGLLPPLSGIYRDDLQPPGLWQRFQGVPAYRELEQVDGLLLSHAHLDHSGYISLLRGDIPIYATAVTAFIAKAMQDSGVSGLDQQVCYFTPRVRQYPAGWKQEALVAGSDKQQRQFCLGDREPGSLSAEAVNFWGETAGQKGLLSKPLAGCGDGIFNLRCFPVDHSIPGACAWGIETASGWVIYSGDLRLHGRRGGLTREFIERPVACVPGHSYWKVPM
ncbi:hypothetical protein ACFLU4_02450 [Chloroflexota bacterium]